MRDRVTRSVSGAAAFAAYYAEPEYDDTPTRAELDAEAMEERISAICREYMEAWTVDQVRDLVIERVGEDDLPDDKDELIDIYFEETLHNDRCEDFEDYLDC